MSIVKVSPKYQIVIPKDVRKHLNVEPGQEIGFFFDEPNSVSLVPLRPMEELRRELSKVKVPAYEREPDRDPTGRTRYATLLARRKRRKAS